MKLSDIKTGDYLYYTERPYGSSDADTLVHIQNVDGVGMAHPISTAWMGEYVNESGKDWGDDLPVVSQFREECWHSTAYTRECGDPSRWMTQHYPLGESGNEMAQQTLARGV